MADMLATVADLRLLTGDDTTTLPDAEGELLLELATGAVQAAAGQLIVETASDTADLMGTTSTWLPLPQRPVSDVTSVEIDSDPVNDWKLFGNRLWRDAGWSSGKPTLVSVVYDHGYMVDDPGIQFARSAALATAAQMLSNPTSATALSIDDYREAYSQTDPAGLVPERVARGLRKRYGSRGRLVRVG